MMIGMLLFWVLVIFGGIWLIRMLLDHRPRSFAGDIFAPREIARQRFARGEISKAEFDQILNDLAG